MAEGRGKFDKECEVVLTAVNADAVMVAVLGGVKGSGFSLSIKRECRTTVLLELPSVLRSIADQIDADNKARN